VSYQVDEKSADYSLDKNGFDIKAELHYAGGTSRTETYFVMNPLPRTAPPARTALRPVAPTRPGQPPASSDLRRVVRQA